MNCCPPSFSMTPTTLDSLAAVRLPSRNPNFSNCNRPPSSYSSRSQSQSQSQCFQSFHAQRRLSISPPRTFYTYALRVTPLPPLSFSFSRRRLLLSLSAASASHEESKPSDIEVENEKSDLKVEAEESQEAWKLTLDTFKEQALKMQSVSQEAYEVYSKKALVVLKETSKNFKIQADKARQELSAIAKEITQESKEYLYSAAENSPEPVKDIVETFASSTDELDDVSKVRDFYLGIPYGALLCVGGFLSFMLTGSIAALRFGVILGGTLLALSILSLRSWRKGEPSSLALKGQTAISMILFLRQVRLLPMKPFISQYFTALVSGAVATFYLYRILTDKGQEKGPNSQNGT